MAPLTAGLGLVESVRWHDDAVWFADWTAGTIHRLDPESRVDEVIARVPSLPLCFDFLPSGELVVFDSSHGRLLRGPAGGPLKPWVDVSDVGAAGNEVIAAPDGGVFINVGNFDPRAGFPDAPVGRLAYVDGGGAVRIVADELAFPNGMALGAGGRTLLLAESHAGRLAGFTVGPGGALSDRRIWAEVPGSAPDGITVDSAGICWYADVPNQEVVGVAEGGRIHARLPLDRGAFSCAAGPEGRLFAAIAHWPGGARMFDAAHTWDGSIVALSTT